MIDLNAAIFKMLSEYQAISDLAIVPVEVEILKQAVCSYSQVDAIHINAFRLKTAHVLGQVQFFRRTPQLGYAEPALEAEIYVSSYLNDCWRRYVVCKEIMHCILDQKAKTHVGNIADLKALAETLVNRSLAALHKVKGFETEITAEIMAIEALFPLELRETHIERYRDGGLTDLQLAYRYKIPEEIVRSAMAPHYIEAVQAERKDRVAFP